MRERAAETKDLGHREVEEDSLSMHTWKQIMQLEITGALFALAFRSSVLIHNYWKGSVTVM